MTRTPPLPRAPSKEHHGIVASLVPARLARLGRLALLGCLALRITASIGAAQSGIVARGDQVFDSRWHEEAFVEIAGGAVHSLARRSDGSVVAWGLNPWNQTDVPPPPAGHAFVGVAVTSSHSLVRYAPIPPEPTRLCEPGVAGVIACPCANPPAGPGRGCDNSAATGGATIEAAGYSYVTADTLTFTASGERPLAFSLLLQCTSVSPTGAIYGQGVRCATGSAKRLFARAASAGMVTLPSFSAGDTTITARSAALGNPILPGESRWYHVYYRDPYVLGGCPPASTFNAGPTMKADWVP